MEWSIALSNGDYGEAQLLEDPVMFPSHHTSIRRLSKKQSQDACILRLSGGARHTRWRLFCRKEPIFVRVQKWTLLPAVIALTPRPLGISIMCLTHDLYVCTP